MQGKCDIPGSARIPVAILGFSSLILAASVWQGLDDFTRAGDVHAIAETAISLNIALMLFAWSQYREALRAWRAVGEASAEALVLETLDPHTGLLNRASFFDRAERLIGELRPGQSLGLLLIDLKRFGSINDAHGHKFGDELLRRVSESVLEVAPQAAICARLGGDEFALALPFHEDETGSLGTLAARVAERLQKPLEIAGVATGVRPAIGVASLEAARANISTLLGQADLAMNAGKKDQRCVTWFHPAMDQVARARSETESGLRAGIAKSEFVPFYQPQIEFATGRIVGFEMLARWKHPSGRLIGPDLFIPVAEEAGLISELSEALIRQALVDARDWDPAVMLSVNVSPVQLRDTSFAARIADLLDEGRFPANRLDLEITESSLIENLALAQAVIREVKSLGVTITMDDFGTGYSSLAHLRALPFDGIKIDRSFSLSLNRDAESGVIVRAIVNLAHNLGLPVTAEGVESGATDLRLRGLGCDRGQGWLFGKAAPAASARALLREQAAMDLWAQEPAVLTVAGAAGWTGARRGARRNRAGTAAHAR